MWNPLILSISWSRARLLVGSCYEVHSGLELEIDLKCNRVAAQNMEPKGRQGKTYITKMYRVCL